MNAAKKRHKPLPGDASIRQVGVLTLTLLALFIPLLIIMVLSFNEDRFGNFPFSFTLKWYEVLFSGSHLLGPTWLSIQLALAVAVATTVIGTLTAIWLTTRASRLMAAMTNLMLLSAFTIPWLILGVGMLLVFNALGLGRSMFSMFLGLCVISLPYVILIVATSLASIGPEMEEAARSLGARPWQVYRRVIIPMVAPAMIAGALMSFMVCFNNFLIQYFLAPFGTQTLPLRIYSSVKVGYTPELNALATVIVVVTVLLVLLLSKVGLRQVLPTAGKP